jgi:glycosyltransferase involved in cell wall biosynthesis
MQSSRVLHLRSSGGLFGAENVIIEISKFSKNYGYTPIIGAINNVDDSYPEFLKLASELNIKTSLFETRGKIDFRCARSINRFVDDNKINIIHTHGYKENFYAILANCSLPKIATNHLWKGKSLKSRYYCLLDTFLIRFCDKIVGVSDEIVEHMNGLGIKNTYKVSNGIDIEKFVSIPKNRELQNKYNINDDDFVLGMISSLSLEKNHKVVLEAIKLIENDTIKLIIVGDGPLRIELENRVSCLGLKERVIFAGQQINIDEHLSLIDIFLLPSLTEGLPMALLEAMSCGKAIIASSVGEVPKVVDHGINGYLIDPNDCTCLAELINKLYKDGSHLSVIGSCARKTVESKFSSQRMASEYCLLYDSLIRKS